MTSPRTPGVAATLFRRLATEKVHYCHWKNNHELPQAVRGKGDLDLLVARQDYERFQSVLHYLGFKSAVHPVLRYPSVRHYYGPDPETGDMIHLHVYLRVITGESHTKNYHLPLEKALLAHLQIDETGVPTPRPVADIACFLLRHYVKASCLPGLYLLVRNSGFFRAEFARMSRQVDEDALERMARKELGFVDPALMVRLYRNHRKRPLGLGAVMLGLRLRWSLRPFRRVGALRAAANRYFQLAYRVVNKLFIRRKKVLGDGALVAIAGLDGAGKTTVVNALYRWLGEHFEVRVMHVGKPPPTPLTVPIRLALWLYRRARTRPRIGTAATGASTVPWVRAVRHLALAWERHQLLARAGRLRERGTIVLCDRYPSLVHARMDSQRIPIQARGLGGILGRIERSLYNRAPIPDALFLLKVPLEVALERNASRTGGEVESSDEIRLRYQFNTDLVYRAEHFEEIDVNTTLDETLRVIRTKVWKHL